MSIVIQNVITYQQIIQSYPNLKHFPSQFQELVTQSLVFAVSHSYRLRLDSFNILSLIIMGNRAKNVRCPT